MAAGILAAPGTEYGPCEGECQHTDCAATRSTATAECIHCDEPIGYDTRFYLVDEYFDQRWVPGLEQHRVYAHARCEESRHGPVGA